MRHDADGTANAASDGPARRASASIRRRARTSRSSNRASDNPAGRSTIAWLIAGSDAAASRPSAAGSVGTVRHAGAGRRSSARADATTRRAVAAPFASGGAKTVTIPGRPATSVRQPGEDARLERQQDAGAVARGAVGGECAAVTERAEPGQGERQDARPRPPAGVRHEPDAAGIVLVAWVVERVRPANGHGRGGSSASFGIGSLTVGRPAAGVRRETGPGRWAARLRPGHCFGAPLAARPARPLTGVRARRHDRRGGGPDATIARRPALAELTFLEEVARLATSARTWDELMRTVIDRATAAADAEVCSVYLVDRDGSGVTLAATNGLDRDQVGVARLPMGVGITGRAAADPPAERQPRTSGATSASPGSRASTSRA